MTANVAERARAEIPPTAPDKRQVRRIIRPLRRRPEPEIPFQRRRDWRRVLWPRDALGPILIEQAVRGPVSPNVHFAHWPDRIVPDQFAKAARIFRRLSLVAHLRSDLV